MAGVLSWIIPISPDVRHTKAKGKGKCTGKNRWGQRRVFPPNAKVTLCSRPDALLTRPAWICISPDSHSHTHINGTSINLPPPPAQIMEKNGRHPTNGPYWVKQSVRDYFCLCLCCRFTFDPWRRGRGLADACSWTCSPCGATRADSAGRTECRWRTGPAAALPSCGSARGGPWHDPWYPVSVVHFTHKNKKNKMSKNQKPLIRRRTKSKFSLKR